MATSLGYKLNKNPIAQSFFVDTTSGIFATKIDVFFAQRDTSFPVTLQLRPMVNGYPSSQTIIPGSTVVIPGSSINVSADASSATSFTFPEPIYLKGLTDYAIVITVNSPDYKIYIAETNQFLLGSTEKRVDRQPTLGSLFYSQNSVTFTAAQNQDLTFKLYQAKFKHNSAAAVFHNTDVPQSLLANNPIQTTAGSSTVKVSHYNHGLYVGNTVTIAGVDSDGVGGLTYSQLTGNKTVTAIDYSGFEFSAGATADSDVTGGGINVKTTKNIPYSIMYPHMQTLQPFSTAIEAVARGTTGKSFAGTETAFQKSTDYSVIKLNQNNEANEMYTIANTATETAELGAGVRSFDMAVNMFSIDSNVSPILDLQRSSLSGISYVIDKQDSAATAGFNVPLNFVNETSANGGSSPSKHITKTITLVEDAVGIKVLFAANRPSTSDIQLYYRVSSGDELITEKTWALATEETSNPADENRTIFREYQYLIGGQGGNLPAFTQMQLKFVFRSTNNARVPVMKDLRVIALSV